MFKYGMDRRTEGRRRALDRNLEKARERMRDVTPLKRDCGRLCGAACCSPDEDGQGGMLLFPGEEELYDPLPEGFEITMTPQGRLLVCGGFCDRALRPLSCMLFPLWIREGKDGAARVETDRRGRYVCPLTEFGPRALDPAFVRAAEEAGSLLLQSEEQRAFLNRVAEQIDLLGRDWLEE